MSDVVVSIDEEAVTGSDDLMRLLDFGRIGRPMTVRVLRAGQIIDMLVTPQERRVSASRR